jgi:hypothetical protein
MVTHARNSSTWELRQEDGEFETSLGYITRPYFKRKKKRKKEKVIIAMNIRKWLGTQSVK